MYLWSGTLSVFSAKVRIAAREKGLDLEIRELPWTRAAAWGEKPAELLAANPRGQVPVLMDGELAVFDSTVINEYLEERCPDVPLLPAGAGERATCRMWEALGDDLLSGPLPVLVKELFMKPESGDRDQAALAAAQASVAAHYDRLEAALADRPYLCGDFSLADIGNFLGVAFCSTLGAGPDASRAGLNAWFERIQARPGVRAELDLVTEAAAAA